MTHTARKKLMWDFYNYVPFLLGENAQRIMGSVWDNSEKPPMHPESIIPGPIWGSSRVRSVKGLIVTSGEKNHRTQRWAQRESVNQRGLFSEITIVSLPQVRSNCSETRPERVYHLETSLNYRDHGSSEVTERRWLCLGCEPPTFNKR